MKTTKYSLIFVIITCLAQCNGQNAKTIQKKYDYTKNMEKKRYYLDYNLILPYTIYLNDVKITNYIGKGPVSGMEYLNEFILASGRQEIRLVNRHLGGNFNIPDDLFKSMKMKIYTSDENEENIQELAVFPFPDTVVPRPYYFEKTWTFETEVPFELEGWKNGQDLRLIEEKELEKMVLEKYEELHEMIDNGDVDSFMAANKKGYQEFVTAQYMQGKKWDFYNANIRELVEDQEGHMQPLENYKVVIQGNGKLVALERIDLPYLGESALFAIDEEETYYTNYIYLYMPQGKKTLEPIRYQIDYGLVGH